LIGVGGVGMAALLALKKKRCEIFVVEKNKKKQNFLKKFNVKVIKSENIK
jgi:D-arabinose 1-dehydrogenase-like Zn-dependent alcohol dehydrogenase